MFYFGIKRADVKSEDSYIKVADHICFFVC